VAPDQEVARQNQIKVVPVQEAVLEVVVVQEALRLTSEYNFKLVSLN